MAGTAARASRQTEDVLQAVCAGLRAGLPIKRTFRMAGIGERTGHEWREAGWREISEAGKDADGELSFRARFAIAVESAMTDFMAPLVKTINEAAQGKGGKNREAWRAAKELLGMRFPDEWSERVHTAKSQKVEVQGTWHLTPEAMRLQAMNNEELQAELESVHWSLRSDMLSGDQLGEVIEYMEDKLSLMRHHYEARTAYFPNRDEAWRPGSGRAKRPVSVNEPRPRLIEHENDDVEIQAAVLQAPDTAGDPGAPPGSPAGAIVHDLDPRPTGLGFNRFGQAIDLAEVSDEDLRL